jgi:hypothetical protein
LVLTNAALVVLAAAAALVEEALALVVVLVEAGLATVVVLVLLPQPLARSSAATAAAPKGTGCLKLTSWVGRFSNVSSLRTPSTD